MKRVQLRHVLAACSTAVLASALAFACGSEDGPPACSGAACVDAGREGSVAEDGGVDATAERDALDAGDASDSDSACPGPAGTLDPTFGDGGMVWLKYPASGAHAVAVQNDGKIVVGGFTGGSSGKFAVVRLLPNGTVDPAFGSAGLVERQVGALSSDIRALAVLPDGRIVATGATREVASRFTFTTLLLLSDGSPDTTFGNGGIVLTTISGRDAHASSIAVQPDGKILVGGSSEDAFNPEGTADFEVVRYSPNGAPDTSFGSAGRATVDIAGTRDEPGVIALAGGGNVLVAGGSSATLDDPIHVNLAVARLTSAGTLDGAFGIGGRFVTNFGGRQRAYAVAIDSSGRAVLGGMNGTAADFGVYRLTVAGGLDTTFGDGGATSDDFGATFDAVQGLFLEENGNVVAIGSSSAGFGSGSIAAARFLPNGALDPSFGTGGKSVTPPAANTDLKGAAAARTKCGYVVVGEWNYDNNTITKSAFGIAQYRR